MNFSSGNISLCGAFFLKFSVRKDIKPDKNQCLKLKVIVEGKAQKKESARTPFSVLRQIA